MEVRNKICVVTGSEQGLGKAFAKILLDHGAKVCISDLKKDAAKLTLEEFQNQFGRERVCFVSCDVTKKEEFISLFNETEKFFNVDCVDMLVNNAGVNSNLGWKTCMDVNIMGLMTGSEIVMERMKNVSKKGFIINIASMAGVVTGTSEDQIGYTASKHAVVALTRTLAVDFKVHGVSIKALCPSFADTELFSSAKQLSTNKDVVGRLVKRSGGLMSPDYVSQGFYKLVTECDNGAVMWAVNGMPFGIIPDTGNLKVLIIGLMARIIGKVNGGDIVTVKQQKLFIFFVFILFLIACTLL